MMKTAESADFKADRRSAHPQCSTNPYVRAFGPIQAEVDSRTLGPRDFGGVKPKQILEILVSGRGHPVPKDRLVEWLWGGDLPQKAFAALETHVSVLRRQLDPQGDLGHRIVLTEPGAYRLASEAVDLDLDRFDRLVEEATRLAPQLARRRLEEAVSLVAGDVFEDEPYALWAEQMRERYRDRVERARLDAAEAALAEGDFASALDHAEQVAAADPPNERACRIAMLALYATGQQEAALRTFQACRERLEELGLDPLPETEGLYVAMLRQEDLSVLLPGDIPRTQPGFRRLVEQQSAAFWWTMDGELRFTSAAGPGLNGLGIDPERAIGKTWPELFPDLGSDAPLPLGGRAALLGRSTTFENEFRGHIYQGHVEPLRDATGRVIGAVGVAIDVSDRWRAEEALRSADERLEASYRGVPIPTYLWRSSGEDLVMVDANEAGVRASAGHIDDYLGRTAAEIYSDEPDILADLTRCLRGRTRFEREMPYVHPDTGQEYFLLVTYVFVPPDRVIVHLQDRTEMRRAREAEQGVLDILRRAGDAIFIVDPASDEILEASPCAAEMLEFTLEELVSKRPSDLHSGEMPRLLEFLQGVLREGRAWSDEFACTTKSGSVLPVEMAATSTRFRGRPAVINLVRPISRRREANPALWRGLEDLGRTGT